MKEQKKLLFLCIVSAALGFLPCSVSAERTPMSSLIEVPEGEGKRYTPDGDGQMLMSFVREARRVSLRDDTTEVWLAEVPDETSHVHGPSGERLQTRNANLVVQADVSLDTTRKEYLYRYTLHNPQSSPTGISNFEVVFDPNLPFSDFKGPPESTHWTASGSWKEISPDSWRDRGCPLWWHGYLSYGRSLDGFSFRSPVLPGIVHCWSRASHPHAEQIFLKGNTVGPVAPPDIFDAGMFLDRLNHILDESLTEGWIEDEKVAQHIGKKLELARTALRSGDSAKLRSTLEDILNKVESERGNSLLSESFGLLKYNIQYWLDRLE